MAGVWHSSFTMPTAQIFFSTSPVTCGEKEKEKNKAFNDTKKKKKKKNDSKTNPTGKAFPPRFKIPSLTYLLHILQKAIQHHGKQLWLNSVVNERMY